MEAKPAIIDILLATYNGEAFISDQLDSIFRQTYPYFRIIARDDGSTDQTVEILKKYQAQNPEHMLILQEDRKNLGATQNFARLLQNSTADYMAFCDQDDIWLPEKLQVSLRELQEMEIMHPGRPCLVYSDMKLIDETGKLLHGSVWQQLHLDPAFFTFNRLLVQNIPHGCTLLFNKAMQGLVSPIPPEAMLHDHWIAIAASAMGEHCAIRTPLVLLRNHSQNVTRKKTTASEKAGRYMDNILSDEAYEKMVQVRVAQATAFRDRYADRLNSGQKQALEQFILLGSVKGLRRKWLYLKNGFFRTTFFHTLKMVLRG